MAKLCTLLVVTIILLSSCGNKNTKNQTLEELNISIENTSEYLNLSDLTQSVSSVSLETNDSTILDQIVRIIHIENAIYIADKTCLYKYDSKGMLQNKICKYGEAPDEYTQISDFQIDEYGNPWVLSRNNRSLSNYSWDGIMKERINLNCWAAKIHLRNKNEMFLYIGNEKDESNSFQLRLLNLKTQEIEEDYLPIDDKKSVYLHIMSDNHFSNSLSDLYFFQMFNDTIYTISSTNQIAPSCYINLGDRNIPSSFFETGYQDVMDFFKHLHPNKYAYGTSLFMKDKDTFWLSYTFDGERYFSVLKDGKSQSSTILRDDVCLLGYQIGLTDLKFFVQSNSELIIVLWPAGLIDYANEKLNEEQKMMFEQKLGNLNIEQNPILLILEMP